MAYLKQAIQYYWLIVFLSCLWCFLYRVCQKNDPCFCQNFIISPPNLIILAHR